YPLDVEGEGDPCDLAEARTRTFSLRKILWVSTPTDEATSRIARKFKEGDQRYYQVPCPHCGHFQKLTWQGIQFDRSDDGELIPESIGYACAECGTLIEERHKRTMLRDGKWVPERPRLSRKVRSYHLSSLYSPLGWLKWEDIIRANLKAGKDPYSRKVWVNTMLGETWKERGEVPDWEALYNRRELYGRGTVPSGVVFLTMGVDVQANRMEYEIVGWGPRRESWSVDYGVIPCDPAQDDWYDPLDELRMRGWPCEDGTHVRIRMVGVDSGYMAPHIYTYCRTRPDTISLKGDQRLEQAAGPLRLVDINHKGRRVRRGAKLRAVGTDFCKAELYSFLRQNQPAKGEMPAGWCHFPQYDEEYFKMLTGEQLVVKKDTRGYSKRVWEKTRERNEALDCRVYARACAAIVGMDRWTEERWKQEAERVGLGAVKRKRPTRPAGQRRTLHGGNSWLG
ncbi:MAG: terminase gpA endonuclease subunit, partial [Planctomycetota bacterium]